MQAGFYPVLPYGFKTDVDPPAPSDIPGLCIQQRRNCHERRRSFPLTARIKRSGRCWTDASRPRPLWQASLHGLRRNHRA